MDYIQELFFQNFEISKLWEGRMLCIGMGVIQIIIVNIFSQCIVYFLSSTKILEIPFPNFPHDKHIWIFQPFTEFYLQEIIINNTKNTPNSVWGKKVLRFILVERMGNYQICYSFYCNMIVNRIRIVSW